MNNCEWSYTAIVAAGNNANILHYSKNNTKVEKGDLILIDAGCEYNYYASDITRCYSVGNEFSIAQKQIVELVTKAQSRAIDSLGEQGATMVSYHKEASKVIINGLIKIGVLTGDLEQNILSGNYKKYYPHGTGHYLGLDVHDLGPYKDINGYRIAQTIQPGMCLTVEPGLYFDINDMNVPRQFRGIGVRIEDDILIDKNHKPIVLGIR